jgi:hypothetical protein
MNKIVREHYPVDKLPEDLREGLGPARTVRLVIEADNSPRMGARSAAVAALLAHRKVLQQTPGDSVSRVSELRDEWDH